MSLTLTAKFDARRFARQQKTWSGELSSSSLLRLKEAGEINQLHAKIDATDAGEIGCWLTLSTIGSMSLLCERCAKSFVYQIESSTRCLVVANEKEIESVQALVAENDEVLVASEIESALQLLEDEILLSLPFSARCSDDCSVATSL